jgi:hypothetical protein
MNVQPISQATKTFHSTLKALATGRAFRKKRGRGRRERPSDSRVSEQ